MEKQDTRHILCWIGFAASLFLVTFGLWLWQANDWLAVEYRLVGKPGMVGFRYVAVSIISLGEGIFVWIVIGTIWNRDKLTKTLAYAALLICFVSLIGAITLQMAG